MRIVTQSLLVLILLACAGCTKASDVSDARRDHILAGPHGWIDLTLHAPVAGSAPASTAAASAARVSTYCDLLLTVNGEQRLLESAGLAEADAAANPVGYRFAVPAGALNTRLSVGKCVKDEIALTLPVTMEKNHVARLEFDGQQLALASTEPFEPATLDAVRGDVAKLHEHGDSTDGTLSSLTKLVLASAILNAAVVVAVLVLVIRRRKR